MFDIESLKFDQNGLIPAVVVDTVSKKVLTVAYMNKESLKISLEKGLTCFFSRSRQELWLKGETSGNYQHIVSITTDCDADALVVEVKPDGPACHEGTFSCFTKPVFQSEELKNFSYDGLMELIRGRKTDKKEGSYTTYLIEKGLDKILKGTYKANITDTAFTILLNFIYRYDHKEITLKSYYILEEIVKHIVLVKKLPHLKWGIGMYIYLDIDFLRVIKDVAKENNSDVFFKTVELENSYKKLASNVGNR